jgi:hypothetical protein
MIAGAIKLNTSLSLEFFNDTATTEIYTHPKESLISAVVLEISQGCFPAMVITL